jgi:hypothetical protein
VADASMTDFADVEQFAREHSACAGITPSAAPDPGGGFQLHLVCACGATFRRPVTMDEAKRPLPLPRTARPAPRPPASTNAEIEAPRPAASADAEIEAPRPAASVDAEMERPRPPVSVDAEMEAPRLAASADAEVEAPRPPASVDVELEAPRPAVSVDAEMEVPSPPPVSAAAEVEATIRAAVEADAAAPAPAAPSPVPALPPSPVRQFAPAKLDPDTTTRTALAQPTALNRQTPIAGARPAPRTRVAWLILFAIVAFGAAGALYFAGVPEGAGPIPALVASAPPPPLDQRQRVPLDEIVGSLRQLQVASSPTASLSMYSSRVSSARADVERFIGSTAAGSERTQVRDIMDVHLLAAAAWKARTVDQKDSWEALGLDPRIEICQSVKRAVELAPPPPNVSRAQARGEAVASAIPLLWECAAAKLAVLDHPPAAQ